MERKEFLKKAGVGSLALGSLPLFAETAWADDDGPERKFYFLAFSHTQTGPTTFDAIGMSGRGRFDGDEVEGGGEFIHFDEAQFATPSLNFIATGGWRAEELLGWTEAGTWGRFVAGVLTVRATLNPCEGPSIRGVTLRVVCNLGPAGISTGAGPEGYTLTLPNGTAFSPFIPARGLTLFTRRCEESADDDD